MMMAELIRVQMLGAFAIERNGSNINDQNNRMRKIWLLLAYMIYHRTHHLSPADYASLFTGKSDEPADAANLKAMFYRARTLLDQIDGSAGHDLIIRKAGSYTWNTDVELQLDVEEFERLCHEGATAEDETLQLELYSQALALYKGDFLPKLSMEAWVMPLAAYYHRIYLETVDATLDILERSQQWVEAAALCTKALKIEPYSEDLYRHLMRCKMALGDRAAVTEIYTEMSDLLFSTFGVMPSEESQAIYRESLHSVDSISIPAAMLRDQLRETDAASGALFCEYGTFKLLYQAQARSLIRSGDTVHISLFSAGSQPGKELSRRSLDHAMEKFKELLLSQLRQGDIVTQCSLSQLIAMLPQANYENSCAVSQRLIKAYYRQYPHAPIDIHFSVQPLEPMETARATSK